MATSHLACPIQDVGFLTCKALSGFGTLRLVDHLLLRISAKPLRMDGEVLLWLQTVAVAWLVVARKRPTFSIAAPRLWNAFPREAQLDTSSGSHENISLPVGFYY